MFTNCGPYNREHKWGPWAESEERGVLVITAGRRAGRIYTVDRTWRERTCENCQHIERGQEQAAPVEWPGMPS